MAEKKKTTKKIKKSIKNATKQKVAKKDDKKRKPESGIQNSEFGTQKQEEKKIVYAKGSYLKSSARKARLVVDMIRGKNALDAVTELEFTSKKAALFVKKVLESAIANAIHNFEMDEKKLVVVEAYANEAPTFKRGRAGSRGRYKKILKRNTHIVIGISES